MVENQEMGAEDEIENKKAQKDVWADEEIDMLLNIFSSETIQRSLEAARSPRDKNAIYQ